MGFTTPPSDQFPQPTRPKFAGDPDQSSDDKFIINRHVHHNIHHPHVSIDLPKTTDHHDPPPPPPPPPPPACYPSMESSSSSSSSAGNRAMNLSPSTGKTPKGEKEAVDELLLILVDCLDKLSTRSREALLMKFFSEVEREERLETFIVDRLKQSKVKALTDLYDRIPPEIKADAAAAAVEGDDEIRPMSRSVVESAEELTLKLERFKIKTLDFEEEQEQEQEEKEGKSQDKTPTK